MFRTRLTTRFGIDHPVVLAPMDLVADARLASAVSAAGGLGLVGSGYGNRSWLERQLAAIGPHGVGCGFITWNLATPDLLDLVLERSPAAIFLSFGDPMPLAGWIHDAGVPLICQVSTLDHARRAIDAGATVLAAQGGEAGGHGTGTRSTFTFVPEVADLVAATAPDTLVLASGGVADGRGLAAALSLGADGVLVGTRFWASQEAVVSRDAQRRALAASGDLTIRTSIYDVVRSADWPAQYDSRVLRNAFLDRWHGREDELRARLDQAKQEFTAAVAADDYGTANVIVGEAVGMVHEVLPAATILYRMIRDAVAALPSLARPATQPSS